MNGIIGNLEKIVVGDRVKVIDRPFSGETRTISAVVIEVRRILGRQTYVIETETGKRKVVGEDQVSKID